MAELSCSFALYCTTQCGSSSRLYPKDREFCVALNACVSDIKPHLRQLKVTQTCVPSEKELILARAGLFDAEDGHGFTICPKHRAELGLKFCSPKKCQYPLHGNRKQKPDRGMNLQMVKDIKATWNTIIPIGAGTKLH